MKLQFENITHDSELTEMEESRMKSNSANKFVIDRCSLLTHQIFIATYTLWVAPVNGHYLQLLQV